MTSAFLLLGGTSTRRDGGGAAIRLVARAFSSTAPPSSTTRRHRQQQRPSVRIIDAVSDGGVCLTSSASARRQQQQHPWSSMMPRRPFATGASSPSVGGRRGASSLGVASHDVEEDLDSALDDILDDVMVEAASDDAKVGIPKSPLVDMDDLDAELDEIIARNMPKAKAARREKDKAVSIDGAKPIPKVFVEEDDPVDYNDPDFLSTSNPHWVQSGMHQSIIDVLSGKGITKFTPVQAEAYLPVLAGRDVIGRSRTGTGKTLAFGIPALLRIERLLKESGKFRQRGRLPSMVVLCPTRELARQVQEEISQVCKPSGIFTTVFHGGVSYEPQSRDLRQGIDILVGTPGRVIDHIQRGNLNLSECNVVVLDEADEMLNMGFAEDVERVLDGVGSANEEKTQCLLFSATTPPWVKNIGRQYQKDVLYIDATSQTGGARTATTVRHLAVQVPPGSDSRKQMLEDIIAVEISKDAAEEEAAAAIAIGEGEEEEINPIASAAAAKKKKSHAHMQQKIFGKTIVFTEKKRDADELVSGGVFKSLTAQALHGDVGQKQRDSTLNAFRSGAFNVLVATDVAARGIDIQDVDLVIQFQPPRDPDTYVHRSGRTGRAGKKGTSIILFGPNEARDIIKIERSLGHGFRFELTGPPTIEAALTAAARTSALATQTIADDTSKYFKEAAADLLSNDEADPIDIVAKCLAAISRRSADVQSRSLLTGEKGIATLEMSNSRGRPVSPGDVMFTVSKLARMSRRDGDLNFESDVGKIKSNFETGTAFFDMDAEDANKLIEFSKDIDAGGAVFKILKEMEIERGRNFGSSRPPPGRGSGRGGRPGRGGPGGGKYQGGRGRSNGRGGGYGQSRGEYRGGGGGGGGGGGYHRRGDNRHNGSHEYGQGGRTGGVRERDGGGRYEGGGNRYGGSGGSRYGGSGGSRYGGGGGNSYGAGGGARQDRSGRGQGGNNDGW